jgi:hypothetical protein
MASKYVFKHFVTIPVLQLVFIIIIIIIIITIIIITL